MKTFQLNNGELIPAVGFGVFQIPNNGPTYEATLAALKAGYRHIDTAAGYMNESDVGKAIKESGICLLYTSFQQLYNTVDTMIVGQYLGCLLYTSKQVQGTVICILIKMLICTKLLLFQ